MSDEVAVNVPTVRGRSPGSLALSREDALSLFVFFVPGHVGPAAITALMHGAHATGHRYRGGRRGFDVDLGGGLLFRLPPDL